MNTCTKCLEDIPDSTEKVQKIVERSGMKYNVNYHVLCYLERTDSGKLVVTDIIIGYLQNEVKLLRIQKNMRK